MGRSVTPRWVAAVVSSSVSAVSAVVGVSVGDDSECEAGDRFRVAAEAEGAS